MLYLDGQGCIDNPNIRQRGSVVIDDERQVIIPNARFECNGRVTSVGASMGFGSQSGNLPNIQIWRPSSPGSDVYNRIGQVQVTSGNFNGIPFFTAYYSTIVLLTNNDRIEFQSDDVIGYYQPSNSQREIWNIETNGYTSYSNNVNSPGTTFDINNVDYMDGQRQPLIEIMFGKNQFLSKNSLAVKIKSSS